MTEEGSPRGRGRCRRRAPSHADEEDRGGAASRHHRHAPTTTTPPPPQCGGAASTWGDSKAAGSRWTEAKGLRHGTFSRTAVCAPTRRVDAIDSMMPPPSSVRAAAAVRLPTRFSGACSCAWRHAQRSALHLDRVGHRRNDGLDAPRSHVGGCSRSLPQRRQTSAIISAACGEHRYCLEFFMATRRRSCASGSTARIDLAPCITRQPGRGRDGTRGGLHPNLAAFRSAVSCRTARLVR